jgi:hypothetical protein
MTDLTHDARLAHTAKQAANMVKITALLIPILIAAIALPLIGGVYLELFERDGGVAGAALRVIDAVPAIFAAVAVVSLHGVLVAYASGDLLSKRASDAFHYAGLWALAAFGVKIVLLPMATAMLTNSPYEWRSDPLDIALMVFAALVLMIGGVLQSAAAALKAENDQIV